MFVTIIYMIYRRETSFIFIWIFFFNILLNRIDSDLCALKNYKICIYMYRNCTIVLETNETFLMSFLFRKISVILYCKN